MIQLPSTNYYFLNFFLVQSQKAMSKDKNRSKNHSKNTSILNESSLIGSNPHSKKNSLKDM